MKVIQRGIEKAEKFLKKASVFSFIAPLATRIVLGVAFIQTGLGKWNNFERTVHFFDGLGIPFPALNAGFIATLEVVGGALLLVGLLTRFWAFMLSSTMVVALLTADGSALIASWTGASDKMPTDITSFTFLLFLLWLIFYGAGAASVDYLLIKKFSLKLNGGR